MGSSLLFLLHNPLHVSIDLGLCDIVKEKHPFGFKKVFLFLTFFFFFNFSVFVKESIQSPESGI